MNRHISSFTLIELLIVIGIVAVISVVVLLTLNPAELLRQARDANRLSDLETINKALNLVSADAAVPYAGEQNIIYVSLPDSSIVSPNTTSTCSTLGLPATPPGWKYQCAAPALYRKVNGTGWIPVDFTALSSGAPFSALPVDPAGNVSQNLYYTYVTGGSHAVAAALESERYLKASALGDGGADPTRIEMGSDLSLWAEALGLVGYWKLDEGSGSFTADAGPYEYNGGGANFPSWTTGKKDVAIDVRSSSCVGGNCRVDVPLGSSGPDTLAHTFEAWVQVSPSRSSVGGVLGRQWTTGGAGYDLEIDQAYHLVLVHEVSLGATTAVTSTAVLSPSTWYHVVGTFATTTATQGLGKLYVNGVLDNSRVLNTVSAGGSSLPTVFVGGAYRPAGTFRMLDGIVDEVKFYRRALSAVEIQAIYRATQ